MAIRSTFRLLTIILSGIVICSTVISLILFQYKAGRARDMSSGIAYRIIETTIKMKTHAVIDDISAEISTLPESAHGEVFESHFNQDTKDPVFMYNHVVLSVSRNAVVYSTAPADKSEAMKNFARTRKNGGSFITGKEGSQWYVLVTAIPNSDYIYMFKLNIEPIITDMISIFEPTISYFRFIMVGTIMMSVLMLIAIHVVSYPIEKHLTFLENSLTEKNSELQENNLLLNIEVGIRRTIEGELKKANTELSRLSKTDALTNIANRRSFDEVLRKEWSVHSRERRPLAILLCDVDLFKKYNDMYGHQMGDSCLAAVASVIKKECKRPSDFAARYGGEEFAVILPETDIAGAINIADAIVKNIRKRKIPHKASSVDTRVTLSVGVASVIPENGAKAESLVKKADKALYKAKDSGRNKWMSEE